ncbi:MAG: hypothetical protein HPY45_08145 [Anaerolineae bacterium]|nr:hypothetical protein [Anaerolineae bacterium]
MNGLAHPFIVGTGETKILPLSRYLPSIAPGTISSWLAREIPPGEWVIDPFGASPLVALEAAQNGYRILTVVNNPVTAYIIKILAGGYEFADFQTALAELSLIRRGDERLETHLQSLYKTRCASCGQSIYADGYVWRRGEKTPVSRLYQCPHCGDEGERPITTEDAEALSLVSNDQLHRARALGLLRLTDEISRESAVEALQTYLPRPLYFLITLLNRIETSAISEKSRNLLLALIISACDEGNNLWQSLTSRNRPRVITTPTQHCEHNLWKSLENSIRLWSNAPHTVPLTIYPATPPKSGGICLFPGRIKNLLPLANDEIKPNAIITAIPRPNQAFWTFSAIWSAWLWGHEALIPMKSALERRRYDGTWHTNAVSQVLRVLNKELPPGLKLFGILAEHDPVFLNSVFVAAEASGLLFTGLATRQGQDTTQAHWITGKYTRRKYTSHSKVIREAIEQFLSYCFEPMPYLQLHAACLAYISTDYSFFVDTEESPDDALKRLQVNIEQIFGDAQFLRKFHSQSKEIESGLWWLQQEPVATQPITLSDRTEKQIIEQLFLSPSIHVPELEQTLCSLMPGLLTPSAEFIHACLESYCEQQPASNHWTLRPQETQQSRQTDLDTSRLLLSDVGKRLGFHPHGENPLLWQSEDGLVEYSYHFTATSIISPIIFNPSPTTAKHNVIVLPGSRSKLLALKLQQDARLAEAVKDRWLFLKFRHLRQLAKRSDLNQQLWNTLLSKDPPLWGDSTQIKMFPEEES